MSWKVRLYQQIEVRSAGECWPWVGNSKVTGGYGALKVEGRMLRAHRLMYELHKGPPGELFVLHKCNNPLCCNPSHLYLGLQAENARDAANCGALDRKLTRNDVREILKLRRGGFLSGVEVARRYGVSSGHICNIWKGVRRGLS